MSGFFSLHYGSQHIKRILIPGESTGNSNKIKTFWIQILSAVWKSLPWDKKKRKPCRREHYLSYHSSSFTFYHPHLSVTQKAHPTPNKACHILTSNPSDRRSRQLTGSATQRECTTPRMVEQKTHKRFTLALKCSHVFPVPVPPTRRQQLSSQPIRWKRGRRVHARRATSRHFNHFTLFLCPQHNKSTQSRPTKATQLDGSKCTEKGVGVKCTITERKTSV